MSGLQADVTLDKFNTLRLKSITKAYIKLEAITELDEIAELCKKYPKFFVLGGGSNLILPEYYEGLVIHNHLKGITIDLIDQEYKTVTAMAGENWDEFVAFCCNNGAHGLENLSLIPGTVGASPIQNIGAYGVEVKDFIDYVTVFDLTTKSIKKLNNASCKFSYRNSYLKNNQQYIVISVTFRLSSKVKLNISYGDIATQMAMIETPTPQDLRNCIIKTRQSKLPNPAEIGNVGSFFHNPIIATNEAENLRSKYPDLPVYNLEDNDHKKISAGWLIDKLGLKGYRIGNVGVYPKQALVLVNYEPASKIDILALAETIKEKVASNYGITLNIEPIIL